MMFEVMLLSQVGQQVPWKVQVWARAGREPYPDETPQQSTSCKGNRQMSLPTAFQILKLHLKCNQVDLALRERCVPLDAS